MRMPARIGFVLTLVTAVTIPLLLAPAYVRAEVVAPPATQPSNSIADFMRYVDAGQQSRLETADASYTNDKGVVVHLVAAVHIGEKSYYQELNRSFEKRDAVLYEMVKPREVTVPGTQPVARSGALEAVHDMQSFMKDALELEFQLDQIDYSKPNFVHADLDAETFTRLQEERGETFEELFIQQLIKALTDPSAGQEAQADQSIDDLIKAFTRPDAHRQIKRVLAQQMSHMEADALGLGDPSKSVLVGERNKTAIGKLTDSMAAGKKDIAIFYGAAHMPDMASRLKELGFHPVATEWHTAWDLSIRADQPSAIESILTQLFHSADEQK